MTRPFSIRAHLLLLSAVSAIPLLAFGAVLLLRLQDAQMAAFGREVVSVTRALSLAIDNRIAVEQSALEVLGRSRALRDGDMTTFYAELSASAALLETNMSLSDLSGQQLLNTQRPPGTVLPMRNGLPWLLQAVRDGRPVVSDVYPAALTDLPLATVEVPVVLEGRPRYVLAGTIKLDAVDELIRAQRLPPDWLGGVLDRRGNLVQRTRDNARWVGQPASEGLRTILQSGPEGWERIVTLESVNSYTGFTRSERTGWSVAISVAVDAVWSPLRKGLLQLLAIGASLAVVGASAALLLARRIARPVSALTSLATAPDPAPVRLSGIIEVDAVAAALRESHAAREAAVAALRESEAELRAATDLNPQRPWTAGPDGRLLTSSKRVSDLAGVGKDALLGDGWASIVHPDDLPGALAAWSHSVRTGKLYSTEFRVREADGSYVWTHARATPRLAPDGTVLRWYGSTEAIQARKLAEAALHDSRAELQALAGSLEARVVAEVAAREAAQARLAQAQRMEALGQLASGIAHDFNNVLQAVGGGLTLIRKRPNDPALVVRIAAMAADATARGAAITGRLLSLSRKGELRAGPVDAPALLHDIAEVLAHTLGTNITVRLDAAAGLPHLMADRGQLETVLINLATNARDAMPSGGVLTLSAHLHEARDGDGLPPGRYVQITAHDTGAGMAPEVLARASEPFFTTKEVGSGTGLGLAMARGFAEQSGGRLQIGSVPGQGTTVSLWLPLATAGLDDGSGDGSPNPQAATRARILVVDDDPLVRGVLAAQLEDLGYSVAAMPDGSSALALLDGTGGGSVSLLVSDLTMPGMDGVALIRAAQERHRYLPAILLTGYAGGGAALAVGGAVSGSFSLLQKPVSATQLADRISALLADRPI